MKALTIRNPWAMEILEGKKTIEYRTWHTKYRGDLLICSSNKRVKDCVCGCALCVAELYDIREHMETDAATGKPFFAGEYEWLLRNIRPIVPIPLKGYVSLWNADVEDRLEFLPRDSAWFEQFFKPLLYVPRKKSNT